MATVASPAAQAGGESRESSQPARRYRSDIDALRAVAVTLVVLYHAGVPGLGGGFVGVDVFFVISGFLITQGLEAEVARSGRVDVIGFWLRRARRLLPAAGVMIALVVCAQMVLRSPLVWDDVLEEGLAAATYWSNEQVANVTGGYFGARVESRALLHTWSLSVEEQFYILWPLVFGRLSASFAGSRRLVVSVLVGLTGLSAYLSAMFTLDGSPMAYFAASSRAWEFLAGGLLALSWRPIDGRRQEGGAWLGRSTVIGLGLILVAGWWVGRGQAFPWPWALLPVTGTCLALVGSPRDATLLGRTLGARPVQHLGRLSYSWYLWHWPVLVLGKEVLDVDVWPASLGLAVGSLGIAELSYRFVENPLRHRRSETRRGEVLGAFVLPVGLLLAVLGSSALYRASLFSDPLVVSVEEAADEWPAHLGRCTSMTVPDFVDSCTFGSADGARTVLVIGDSHAAHWMPAFDAIGERNDMRFIALQAGSCPLLQGSGSETSWACQRLRDELPAALDRFSADLVISSASQTYIDGDESLMRWQDGHEAFARSLAQRDVELLVMHDNGRWSFDPLECLVDNRDGDCGLDRAAVELRREPVAAAERAALEAAGHGRAFDPLDLLCGSTRCEPMTADGDVVMQDEHHITRQHAARLAAGLEVVVLDALS